MMETPFLRKERREKKGDKHRNQRREKKGHANHAEEPQPKPRGTSKA
jgi:hypothetical protein